MRAISLISDIMKKLAVLLLLVALTVAAGAQTRLERATPEEMNMDGSKFALVDNIINKCIADTIIPGAVVAIVRGDKLVYLKAYGNKRIYPYIEKMTENTVFDMASCSKSLGTALSFMNFVEKGNVRLTDKVSMYIPGFQPYVDPETGKKTDIRIVDLLTHSSGLPAYVNPGQVAKDYGSATAENLLEWIKNCKRGFKPTTDFRYSCLNFITLQHILQNVTGERLCDYAQKNIFDALGLKYTTYSPKAQNKKEIMALVAPTEKQPDGECLLGEVHDPLARVCNQGNSGNAGLFTNAEDVAVICAALMNGGAYKGKRILGELTVKAMTRVPDEVKPLGRSLGWDNYSDYNSYVGNLFTPYVTFGHSGYTGPSVVVDPVEKVAVIVLTNRCHPYDTGGLVRQRALIANIVAGSVTGPAPCSGHGPGAQVQQVKVQVVTDRK